MAHHVEEGYGSVRIGEDYWEKKKNNSSLPVIWDEMRVANHHIGVAGTSGAGKTHWIRRFVDAMPPSVEIDILDYHGDIEVASETVLFSERTRYGYNPLVLNTDVHFGGVRRGVRDVVDAISRTSRELGFKQERVLQNLLMDCYAARGICPDDPATWIRQNPPKSQIDAMIKAGLFEELRTTTYPGLEDVIRLAKRKLKALWLGVEDDENNGGRGALAAFDDACKAIGSAVKSRLHEKEVSDTVGAPVSKLEQASVRARDKALTCMSNFFELVETGREFDEVVKYHSKEVLLSVISRLENLVSIGIFSQNPPPFGNARVRRYNLRPIAQSESELKMFVIFRLRAIIREEMQKGESHGRLRRLIVLDEAKKFNDEDPSNPINVIACEMRKFGVGLLMAGQSPAHFSEDFVKNAGTLLILHLATTDWGDAARHLKIEENQLKHLRPRQTGTVRMLEVGEPGRFRQVQF